MKKFYKCFFIITLLYLFGMLMFSFGKSQVQNTTFDELNNAQIEKEKSIIQEVLVNDYYEYFIFTEVYNDFLENPCVNSMKYMERFLYLEVYHHAMQGDDVVKNKELFEALVLNL